MHKTINGSKKKRFNHMLATSRGSLIFKRFNLLYFSASSQCTICLLSISSHFSSYEIFHACFAEEMNTWTKSASDQHGSAGAQLMISENMFLLSVLVTFLSPTAPVGVSFPRVYLRLSRNSQFP